MKRALPIPLFVPLVPILELACWRLPVWDWFCLHVGLVLAVLIAGAALWFPRRSRRFASLLLSAGAFAALAGISAYFIYPLLESPSPPAADRIGALANALSPIYYAGIAMALGLFLGWLPAWLYARAAAAGEKVTITASPLRFKK